MKLGKLKTVDLRLQREHEAHNFTKWLESYGKHLKGSKDELDSDRG